MTSPWEGALPDAALDAVAGGRAAKTVCSKCSKSPCECPPAGGDSTPAGSPSTAAPKAGPKGPSIDFTPPSSGSHQDQGLGL